MIEKNIFSDVPSALSARIRFKRTASKKIGLFIFSLGGRGKIT